jgi:putative ABC transport system permease protein
MLSSYLKIAFRNLLKNKIHTLINLMGLAFGMASVFLIAVYLKGELNYDRFHVDAERIYRITWEDENPQTRTPHPMAQAMATDFAEVESAVSLTPLFGAGLTKETHSFRNLEKDERYDEANILAVDTTFFDVFTFPLLQGNPKTALHHVNGLLISESMAKKYFGDTDPMGKHLAVDSDTLLVEIVGVFKDVPQHAHFHFDFLISYLREKSFDPEDDFFTWEDFGHYNYVKLSPGADAKNLEGRLMGWAKNYFHATEDQYERLVEANFGFRLQPMTDIHLHSRLRWELEPNGNIYYVYILGTAAILTLIIACVNFINLTTAKSAERAKEIGIRKSLGAFRKQLAMQFISESLLVAITAAVVAALLIEVCLPLFNSLTGTRLVIDYGRYLTVLICMGCVIGLMAGLYPAFYLSSVRPSLILKGNLTESRQGNGLQNGLIVFQFALSMALIAGSIVIFNQLGFLKDYNIGFSREGVLVLPVKNDLLREKFEPLRNELQKIEGVYTVSAASNIPGKQFNQNPIAATDNPLYYLASSECVVDADFFSTLGIELKEGRVFSRDHRADSTRGFILNETAASQLNVTVGSELNWDRDGSFLRGDVIGIVKDFHFQSLHEPLRPLLFALGDQFNFILIRTDLTNFQQRISAIETTYKRFDTLFAFEYSFLDDQLDLQYTAEKRLGNATATFAIVAVVIAASGLFAIAILGFYRRTKEISIRKILGASPAGLVYLLLKNFTAMVLVAAIVATPLTWWIMDRWLENFNYRVTIGPFTFVLAAISLMVMCWITLSYLTLKTTRLNPAETLKME